MNDKIMYKMENDKSESKLEKAVSNAVIGFSILETEKTHALINRFQNGYSKKVDYSKILSYDMGVVQEAGAYVLPYALQQQGLFSSKPFRINVDFTQSDVVDSPEETSTESKGQ